MTKSQRVAAAVEAVGAAAVEAARLAVIDQKSLPKEEVFRTWIRVCHSSRIASSADIREQRKSWMIYDIIRKWYGEVVANAVA